MESRVPEGQAEPRFDAVERAIDRHRAHPSRAPIPPAQREAFEEIVAFFKARPGPWIFDTGCGTGLSTHRLARLHGLPVVGVDRSAARLARGERGVEERSEQALVLRADLPAIWKLMRQAGLRATRCYLLYPNPAPKTSLMGRRWYAHPSFEDLLATCESLELRTNWSVYAEEFAHALSYRLGRPHAIEGFSLEAREPLSPFEHKYHESGHRLFRVCSEHSRGGASLLETSSP